MTPEAWDRLVSQVKRHEGCRLTVYEDTLGIPTIGYGRNLRDRGITLGEADTLLEHDLRECLTDCNTLPWFSGLDSVRQTVVVNMRFNLGSAGLRKFAKTLAAIARGEYAAAAEGMLASRWARQVKGRAVELAEMMRTGHAA